MVNTVNYGCYNNATVNSLITQAEAATSMTAAGTYWQQADKEIMKDAVIVPMQSQNFPLYASSRVSRRRVPQRCSRRTSATPTSPRSGSPTADRTR